MQLCKLDASMHSHSSGSHFRMSCNLISWKTPLFALYRQRTKVPLGSNCSRMRIWSHCECKEFFVQLKRFFRAISTARFKSVFPNNWLFIHRLCWRLNTHQVKFHFIIETGGKGVAAPEVKCTDWSFSVGVVRERKSWAFTTLFWHWQFNDASRCQREK